MSSLREQVHKLIKEARVSCPEATVVDKLYELAPELWELVCDEFGYYDWNTETVLPLEEHEDE